MAAITEHNLVSINTAAARKLVADVVENDINELLDKLTEEVLEKAKARIRRNVALNVMSRLDHAYNAQYDRDELVIRVRIDDNTPFKTAG